MALKRKIIRRVQARFNALADPKRKVNDAFIIKTAVRIEQLLITAGVEDKTMFEVRSKRTNPMAIFDLRVVGSEGVVIVAEIEVPRKSQSATRLVLLGHALRGCQTELTRHIGEVDFSVKHIGKDQAKKKVIDDILRGVARLRRKITY